MAFDGDWNNETGPDRFRIKIWGSNGIVYDNGLGSDDNSNDATELGGGSIVIHEIKGGGNGNNKNAEVFEKTVAIEEGVELNTVGILSSLAVAPNPVRTDARVRFSLVEDDVVTLRVFATSGREVGVLFSGNVKANEVQEVGFLRRNLPSGMYIVKLTTDRGNSYNQQVILE